MSNQKCINNYKNKKSLIHKPLEKLPILSNTRKNILLANTVGVWRVELQPCGPQPQILPLYYTPNVEIISCGS